MTDKNTLRVTGLYRVRNEAPGFAICLFRLDDKTVFVKGAGDDGRITDFAPVNVDGSFIFEVPPRSDGTPWSARIGQSMLYAFHRPDGSFTIGPREEVAAAVREELPNLRALPFLWEEAASFIGDQDQLVQAKAETAKLLRHPTWGRKKAEKFT